MKFYLAPLEGVTGYIFRNALDAYFPGTDRYFTPFIVPDQKHALRKKELRDILPENNQVKELVPQILTSDPVRFVETAKALAEYERLGYGGCPVCIAKTQYSFSSDPKAYGVAKNFELKVRDIIINNGAEMIVVIMGEIMRMPGLPKDPQAKRIDIVDGVIEGLS